MQFSPVSAHPVSPYVKAYNSLKIDNNNFLIRSVIASITEQPAPQYPGARKPLSGISSARQSAR